MVSGVRFNNPSNPEKKKKKRSIASTGLIVVFLLLVLVMAAYSVLFLISGGLTNKIETLDQSIKQQQEEIDAAVASVAPIVLKKDEVEKNAFMEASTGEALLVFQDMMVPQIVLKSFEHSYIERDDLYRIALSADANNFDVMATQVKIWKESPAFSRVTIGESDRDEEGRILFSAEFDLAPQLAGEAEKAAIAAAAAALAADDAPQPAQQQVQDEEVEVAEDQSDVEAEEDPQEPVL